MTYVIDAQGRIKEYIGPVALADLTDYSQGAVIYGGAAAWEDKLHPAEANRVLQSTAAEVGWSAKAVTFPASGAVPVGTGAATQVAFWTDANTIAGDAGLTYAFATNTLTLTGGLILSGGGSARITINDNVGSALTIVEAGLAIEYLQIETTDAQPEVVWNDSGLDVDHRWEAVGASSALFIEGSTGFVGIWDSTPDGHFSVRDTTVDTTVTYYGIKAHHVKTAGATTSADEFYGIHNYTAMNDADSTIGYVTGFWNEAVFSAGTLGSGADDFEGFYNRVRLSGGDAGNDMLGGTDELLLDTGTVADDVYGRRIYLDIDAGMTSIGGDAYGLYIRVDDDLPVTGNVYMLYLKELTGVDYGIYQDGTADNYLGGNLIVNADIIVPKTSGNGIKVEPAAPTFPFRDLLGDVFARNVGASKPTFTVYRDTVDDYQFGVGDEEFFKFHIPHDYVAGTDIFLHIHWSHTGTFVTGGTITFEYEATYCKGWNQAAFPATITGTVVGTASTTQYQQIISEDQISDPTPGAGELDTDDLEPDGIIIMRVELQANAMTVSEGGVPDPFIHYVDIHYQSTNMGTKSRSAPFYV